MLVTTVTPLRARADTPTAASPDSAASSSPSTSPPPDPAMDALRARFRTGMDHYRAGRFGDAIVTWEQIHRELGTEAGYRLAFNLARAYDAAGDVTKAAEHYESYVEQVARRRARGEALEALVEKQDVDARERIAQLGATRGRIRVAPGDRPTAAQIDAGEPRLAGFVAYVAPGDHTVTFGAGADAERVAITVTAGQIVEVTPARRAPPPVRSFAASTPPAPAPPRERPFSATWLTVAGGVTLASAVVPAIAYATALGTKSDYDASTSRTDKESLAADYESERSVAHVSLAVTSGLAAMTGALVATWFLWPPRTSTATPTASATPSGAVLGVVGRF